VRALALEPVALERRQREQMSSLASVWSRPATETATGVPPRSAARRGPGRAPRSPPRAGASACRSAARASGSSASPCSCRARRRRRRSAARARSARRGRARRGARSPRARVRSATIDRLAQRLADLDLPGGARGQPEPHRLARRRHRRLELEVALAGRGKSHRWTLGSPSRLSVDLVADERRERREQLRDRHEAVAQRLERHRLAVPEAPARAADVPVREILDELGDRAPGAVAS
jgi:hypothetical protein